jgi:hypothetical protein
MQVKDIEDEEGVYKGLNLAIHIAHKNMVIDNCGRDCLYSFQPPKAMEPEVNVLQNIILV